MEVEDIIRGDRLEYHGPGNWIIHYWRCKFALGLIRSRPVDSF